MRVGEVRSAAGGRLANVSAALLLGGPSAKFGSDKADAMLAGSSLAEHAASMLSTLFEDVLLVGGDPRSDLPGKWIGDPEGPQCPLRGLVAALEAAREARVLVLAVDLPLLTPDLMLALTAWPEAELVAPRQADRVEALCAIYSREAALPIARKALESGRAELREVAARLDGSFVEHADLRALDPEGQAFFQIDTKADLESAAALLPS